MVTGTFMLAILPNLFGVAGYILAIIVLTRAISSFWRQTTPLLLPRFPHQHGTVSGLLNLSRNLGLIAGASLMGQVFSLGVGTEDFIHATPAALANGMQLTFFLSGGIIVAAIAFFHLPRWKRATQ